MYSGNEKRRKKERKKAADDVFFFSSINSRRSNGSLSSLSVCSAVCELTTHLLLETFFFYRRIFALALAISLFSVAEASKALPVQALSFFLSLPVLLSGLPHCSFPPPPTFFSGCLASSVPEFSPALALSFPLKISYLKIIVSRTGGRDAELSVLRLRAKAKAVCWLRFWFRLPGGGELK